MNNVIVHRHRSSGFKEENHLTYTLWFRTAAGKNMAIDGVINFELHSDPIAQIDAVLKWMSPFVKENWFHLEIYAPNRDAYGRIQPGHIQDTGVLFATRIIDEASAVPDSSG